MSIRATLHNLLNYKEKIQGILPDKEILRLSIEEDMIRPFTAAAKTPGVISRGLTSYGYDVTASKTFRIFNTPSDDNRHIDPKNFDETMCEVVTGDVITIPPHGFALTHTNEYFKIPEDVLVICVGKSTYARCFTGDTKVALADGTYKTFLELIAMEEAGEEIIGVSLDTKTGAITNPVLTSPRKVGTEQVYTLTTELGYSIKVTPDHEFITIAADGSYVPVQAQNLLPDMNIAQFTYATAVSDSVKSILPEINDQDVYCITAPNEGTFALENGFFVSNCGIIVNVTPIEPGFEGQVVLELSNTTPRPVVVYANEGISQFVFIRGEKCDISYSGKRGKYQGQRGITFPRID